MENNFLNDEESSEFDDFLRRKNSARRGTKKAVGKKIRQKLKEHQKNSVFGDGLLKKGSLKGKVRLKAMPPSVVAGIKSLKRKLRLKKRLTDADRSLLKLIRSKKADRIKRRRKSKLFFK